MRLPDGCLVVLVGASGAGKSHWAGEWFRPEQIVSSDQLRGVVGEGDHDQRASKDAFAVLDLIVDRRLLRGLTTVIDSTALEAERRRTYLELAARHGAPAVAVVFATEAAVCRARNKSRDHPVPAKLLTAQLLAAESVATTLSDEGFASVVPPGPVAVVAPAFLTAPTSAARQREVPMPLEFGLQISRFTWPGGPPETARRLADIARTAEQAGFTSLWVMDHFLQIPVVGREWEDMLESYTTLGYLAAVTERATLGTLVTGVTYRNLAHLAKIVATLDVLSEGRAVCGLGAAWFAREHQLYGWDFPPVTHRYDLLEDALRLLPLMWGKGAPSFEGKTTSVPETICYPRPLQEHVPLLVGGSGERRTLRLVAEHADACNLFGDPATVRHKVDVLAGHCADVGRDLGDITVTHLSTARVLDGGEPRQGEDSGTVEEQVGRYRELAEAGVQMAIIGIPDAGDIAPVERFADVAAAFS
jgi:F420-dependent oxidoreductase-like protein